MQRKLNIELLGFRLQQNFCFLTTDNWLKSLKYGILIGLNQFLPENATH